MRETQPRVITDEFHYAAYLDEVKTLAAMDPADVRRVIDIWAEHSASLGQSFPWVQVFENRGAAMGASNPHPHGQIYAYPFVTPRTRRMLDAARRHRERTWRNLFADLLAGELADELPLRRRQPRRRSRR